MKKINIQNRSGKKIVVLLDEAEKQKGLAFVMHGLGGFKEQAHVETFARSFKDSGFTVLRFDATNSIGESDGDYADATVTNYYADLVDVIAWASKQKWYQEPFALAGHSLGGICTALYAEKYPEKVLMLTPISSVVSGRLSTETDRHKKIAKEWEESGWHVSKSESKQGVIKHLKWSHMEDRLKYDLLPEAGKLKMPVLLIVGGKDEGTPLAHQQILFDAIPVDKKELHVIKNAPHTFRDEGHLKEIYEIFSAWIQKCL
ncbi:MAG: alpha/beta fold hydrolase [bacterium]|nr:alpha/beta fold hydrolase [bacterium]